MMMMSTTATRVEAHTDPKLMKNFFSGLETTLRCVAGAGRTAIDRRPEGIG